MAARSNASQKSADHDMARFMTAESGRPFFHYDITAHTEMLPSPSNRVVLTPERDRWGLHRPSAHCVIDASDFQNVERTLRVFGETLIRLGKGRVRVNNDRIYRQAAGEGHTLGTTRMGDNPSSSVVDPDCRVHGYDNSVRRGIVGVSERRATPTRRSRSWRSRCGSPRPLARRT